MVTATVPAMVVARLASIAFPVTFIVLLSIVMRHHPLCSGICGTSPISVVPLIVVAYRIPVAGYPRILCARTSRLNPHDAHRRRGADSHSDGELSKRSTGG